MLNKWIVWAALGLVGIALPGFAFAELADLDAPEPTVNGHFQISANWSQLKRGWNTLTMELRNAANQPIAGANVAVAYEMMDMPMNPPEKPVEEKGDGFYEKRVFLGMKGKWKFSIVVNAHSVEDTLTKVPSITN